MTKKALLTGVNGQDGSYMAEFLLDKGYKVYGLHRRYTLPNFENLWLIKDNPNFHLIEGDVSDPFSVRKALEVCPDEIYNFAAQSHVGTSFSQPDFTFRVNTLGVLNILEGMRGLSYRPRLLQCSTSEMFGDNFSIDEGIKYQNELTPFSPISPYAVSKVAAHHLVDNYRKAYGIFGCCSICFNHESERRGLNFVTRKITNYVGELAARRGLLTKKLKLGNRDTVRDWSYAPDFIEGMWLALQKDEPDDYVLSSNQAYTLDDFLKEAFRYAGFQDWEQYVEFNNPADCRPSDVTYLRGDSSWARIKLGWKPKVSFEQMIHKMVDYDTRIHQG